MAQNNMDSDPQTSSAPPPTPPRSQLPPHPPNPHADKEKGTGSESRARSASRVQRLADARVRARNRLKVVGSRVRTVSSKINQRTAAWRARRRSPKASDTDGIDLPTPAVLATLAELGEVWHASASPQDTEYEMLLERLWAATHGRGVMVCDTGPDPGCESEALPSPSPFCRSGLGWIQLGFQRSCPDHDFSGGGVLSLQCLVYLAERKPALWCNDLRAEHSSTERAFSLQNVLRARAQRRQVRGEQGGKGASRWDSSAVEVAPGTDARVRDDGRPVGGVGGGGEGASDDGNSDTFRYC